MAFVVKIGLEMHQQLDTGKLFCRCPSRLSDEFDMQFTRVLRPVVSELGEVDRAALMEARRGRGVTYRASRENSCAVEWDEEPPHGPDPSAVRVALQIARLLGAKPVDEIEFMRKMLIDGSVVSGFQRTALIATHGEVEGIGIETISLEEDSARPLEGGFSLDRLGIPLVEVATAPEIHSGEQARDVAKRLGTLFRMARVRRGLGTIRQDLNVSIPEGARVEIKGVQELDLIPVIVKKEVARQAQLAGMQKQLATRFTETREVTGAFEGTDNPILEGRKAYAATMKGGKGLFARDLHQGKHLGKELAEYVRSFGHGGFFHSDEGKLKEEFARVKEQLGAGNQDLLIVAAGDPEIIGLVKERVKQFSEGVPEDTRRANPDGSTTFLRPLPTGARMYPETDVLPFEPPEVEPLETPEERYGRLREHMPDSIARKLCLSPDHRLFDELSGDLSGDTLSVLATTITEDLPSLRRRGKEPTPGQMAEVMALYEEGKVTKGGTLMALEDLAEGKGLEVESASAGEVREFVRELVQEREDYVKSARNPLKGLMGPVMGEFRGRFPGKQIASIIQEEIDRLRKKG